MKLKVLYTPEGGSRREWVVDLANPAWDVMSQTERATEWPWEDFRDRLGRQSAIAFQALLWVLRKRDEPRLQLTSVQVDFDELDFEAECPECKQWMSQANLNESGGHDCDPAEPSKPTKLKKVSGGEA